MQNEATAQEGRPTKYKVNYAKQAYRLCLLGATDKQIAESLEVSVDTVYEWKNKHKQFSEALRRGKITADARVAYSLYRRAIGFSYDEVTFEKIDLKAMLEITPNEVITTDIYKKKVVTKYVVPDTGAIVMWLKNRQRDLWRDKAQDVDFEKLTEDQLDQIINRLKQGIK